MKWRNEVHLFHFLIPEQQHALAEHKPLKIKEQAARLNPGYGKILSIE